MRKALGLFLTFIGLLILLKVFYPEVYNYLAPYARYIRASFLGVALILFGLYILSKNRTWRTAIAVIFVLYLALYIAVPEESGEWKWYSVGWSIEGKIEGDMHTFGSFKASTLMIENLAAEMKLMSADGDEIKVISNLPIEVKDEGGVLSIKCTNACERYKNGKLIVEVGRDANLRSIEMANTVGDYNINLENELERLTIENTVGDFEISNLTSDEVYLENTVGRFIISIDDVSTLTVRDGIGDIDIHVPAEYKVSPSVKGSLASLEINANENGTKTLNLVIENVIGKVVVERR
ncbi:hypothetical protein PAP_05580 [Palaeococcus pacificus DY20341]|uniref:Uncharacterized protein n=1 Tax=Palaeococcus pacificus DY20341 TaxID=1343739 RepID=A0A075LT85_9EURY|nr:DUF4097 family beta strand repeat-containing protein [Palaeococcus pacificus]AIF69519.1 hypothetical protein PAP_05580 [Palaeococcus pacificus DY20341]